MSKALSPVVGLALAGLLCGQASAIERMIHGFPDLPGDARRVAERSLACGHFAGEFNGDGSARDKEVSAQLRKLKCDTVERDLERMRAKYRQDPRIMGVLEEAGPV